MYLYKKVDKLSVTLRRHLIILKINQVHICYHSFNTFYTNYYKSFNLLTIKLKVYQLQMLANESKALVG